MDNNSDPNTFVPDRPHTILAGVACEAWQAYNAMQSTKERHYELVQRLDNKKKNYNLDPSASEQAWLAHFLADHDEQVKRFAAASSTLKQTDPSAHQALFVYIGVIAQQSEEATVRH